MLDESLLDAPEALARADRRGLLRGAAEAGARVRTAARHATEAGISELNPEGRPRAVLVAGSGTAASGVADLIAALAGASAPVTRIHPTGVAPAAGAMRWTLPGWWLRRPAPHRHGGRVRTGPRSSRRAGVPPRLHRSGRGAPPVAAARSGRRGARPRRPDGLRPARRVRRRDLGHAAPAPSGPCSPRCSRSSTASAWSPRPRRRCRASPTAWTARRSAVDRRSPRTATRPRPSPPNSRTACPSSGRRATPRARSGAGSPRSWPNSPAARPSRPNSPRRSPPTAPCWRGPSPPGPTRTTSSATGSRSPKPFTPASSCSGTAPPAA